MRISDWSSDVCASDLKQILLLSWPTAAAVVLNWRSSAKRSEEHTSELQSLMRISYAVFCLKKKNIEQPIADTNTTPHPTQIHITNLGSFYVIYDTVEQTRTRFTSNHQLSRTESP